MPNPDIDVDVQLVACTLLSIERSLPMKALKGSKAERNSFLRDWRARIDPLAEGQPPNPDTAFDELASLAMDLYDNLKDCMHDQYDIDWYERLESLNEHFRGVHRSSVKPEHIHTLRILLRELETSLDKLMAQSDTGSMTKDDTSSPRSSSKESAGLPPNWKRKMLPYHGKLDYYYCHYDGTNKRVKAKYPKQAWKKHDKYLRDIVDSETSDDKRSDSDEPNSPDPASADAVDLGSEVDSDSDYTPSDADEPNHEATPADMDDATLNAQASDEAEHEMAAGTLHAMAGMPAARAARKDEVEETMDGYVWDEAKGRHLPATLEWCNVLRGDRGSKPVCQLSYKDATRRCTEEIEPAELREVTPFEAYRRDRGQERPSGDVRTDSPIVKPWPKRTWCKSKPLPDPTTTADPAGGSARPLKTLELCAGTARLSIWLRKRGCVVTVHERYGERVEWDAQDLPEPDTLLYECDVLEIDPSKLPIFDYIHASPECSSYSAMSRDKHGRKASNNYRGTSDEAAMAKRVLKHLVDILKSQMERNPKLLYTIENPWVDCGIHKQEIASGVIEKPQSDGGLGAKQCIVTYCMFEPGPKKPTLIWTNSEKLAHDLGHNRRCGHDGQCCDAKREHGKHPESIRGMGDQVKKAAFPHAFANRLADCVIAELRPSAPQPPFVQAPSAPTPAPAAGLPADLIEDVDDEPPVAAPLSAAMIKRGRDEDNVELTSNVSTKAAKNEKTIKERLLLISKEVDGRETLDASFKIILARFEYDAFGHSRMANGNMAERLDKLEEAFGI